VTPLDGARPIPSISATLFGDDEFSLREISPEAWLASAPSGARQGNWMGGGRSERAAGGSVRVS
jgi:hypothetical protein